MTNLPTQDDLVDLGDVTPATMPVAVLSKEPEELVKEARLQFSEGFDDLDYVTFSNLSLPSGHRVTLVRHKNSPSPGIEVCTIPNETNVTEILVSVLKTLKLSSDVFTWVHPAYEQEVMYKSSSFLSPTSLL
jgi:hypothetical protein